MERDRGGRPRYPGVLTPAEQRVLDELREGGTNAEIAERLGLSRETVKTHIASMLSKLDLADRGELAAWRPEPPRRGALGWLGLLVRPAVGLGGAAGVVAVVVVFAVVIGASRNDAPPVALTVSPDLNIEGCSGVAVTDPEANTELVADCESLLGLRNTIRGTQPLDWTGSKPMPEWTGVTVSGTPQRVTALDLAGLGLDGQLSGLLGNLTGLTTLDLSGNPLTGRIPSKLTLLTNLRSISITGTDFEGCAPQSLGDVATNDVTLDDCGETEPVLENLRSGQAPPAGTFRAPRGRHGADLIFDIPEDSGLIFIGAELANQAPVGGDFGLIFQNAEGTVTFMIDVRLAGEWPRKWAPEFISSGTASGYTRAEYEAIFDGILESMWIEEVDD